MTRILGFRPQRPTRAPTRVPRVCRDRSPFFSFYMDYSGNGNCTLDRACQNRLLSSSPLELSIRQEGHLKGVRWVCWQTKACQLPSRGPCKHGLWGGHRYLLWQRVERISPVDTDSEPTVVSYDESVTLMDLVGQHDWRSGQRHTATSQLRYWWSVLEYTRLRICNL